MRECGISASLPLHINPSIIQGSGVGPTVYIIMESDLKHFRIAIYSVNMLMTLTLLFQVILGINEEFINIENWARANKMIINFSKTKGVVFRRPGLTHFINPPPINNFEQVDVDNITIFKMAAVRHFGFVVTSQYCTRGHVHFLCPKCRSKISC